MEGLNIAPLESLQSKDKAALLDTVDEIRRHGVSRYILLPQIVVCGDQSSGKSSVLEAISGVHFPVNDGLCTRFTTEVILRRAPRHFALVTLIPAKDASDEHQQKLLQFEQSSISHVEIPTLISEAKTIMGLTSGSSFSRDILKLDISGPKLPDLTLIDLPGLIHHPNKEQTQDDVDIPKELVKKYIWQPRTIVLAIVTAKNDISNQVVLKLAKEADAHGARTMGIITKPDCLLRDSYNEAAFFALASNKETSFKLDWHVLRNGDFSERKNPDYNRDKAEKEFFASGIWKKLPSSKRGVDALRTRLSHVLFEQIQKELPGLVAEIEQGLADCKTVLDRLGSPRDTPDSRRSYLTAMADRFRDLVRAGNDGNYRDPFFKVDLQLGQNDELVTPRLRANLRREEQKFVDRMHKEGHTYHIVPGLLKMPNSASSKSPGQTEITETEFLQEIRVLLDHSKGRELPGTFTPLLVGDLFLRQSRNWETIAMKFAEEAWGLVKKFLDEVLAHVSDEGVRHAVLEEVIDPAMESKLSKLKEKVNELYSPYCSGYPTTLNSRFVLALKTQRSQLFSESSWPRSKEEKSENEDPKKRETPKLSEDPDTHACQDLLGLMQCYYEVALDVFVDNVASLGIENCLMTGLKDILSPLSVSEMNDEMLEAIAFESDDVREIRSQTLEKQASLQKSYELCRRQARKLASNRLNPASQIADSPVSAVKGSAATLPGVGFVSSNIRGAERSWLQPAVGTKLHGLFGSSEKSTSPDTKPAFGSKSVLPGGTGSIFGSSKATTSSSGGGLFGGSVLREAKPSVDFGQSPLADTKPTAGFGASPFGSIKSTGFGSLVTPISGQENTKSKTPDSHSSLLFDGQSHFKSKGD
jgi:GTPase SAR1 family protein